MKTCPTCGMPAGTPTGVHDMMTDCIAALKQNQCDLADACQHLLDYRKRNTLNFQLEKADDYLAEIEQAIRWAQ